MATKENTSSSTVTEDARTFHEGLFKISNSVGPREKLEQASLFLAAAGEGVDEMVAFGEANLNLLWGYAHMIETAKALVDSANREVAKGGAA